MVGNGMGAKNGILFKTAVSLETTGKTEIVVLDKTGTITLGEPKVTDVFPAEGVSVEELMHTAYLLEGKSEHPLAKAVVEYVCRGGAAGESSGRNASCDISAADDSSAMTGFVEIPGNGVRGQLAGKMVYGGKLEYIDGEAEIPPQIREEGERLARSGKTPLYFAEEKRFLGCIAVADVIKEDSPQAIRELKNMGIRVVMLTGDNEKTAAAIGDQAGVDEIIAGVLPEGKEEQVRRFASQGKVAMVGDGINDAPALTRADIGIAIGAGTDVAVDAADVVLMKSRLSDVTAAIRLSRGVLRNIHENLFWAFIYNVIGIPLAAGVWIPLFGWQLNPMFGAAAMGLSSFCVVSNALRLNLLDLRNPKRDKIQRTKKRMEKENVEMKKTMTIEGMMCGHCQARVKKCLEALDGVESAEVSHEKGTAVVTLAADVANEILKKAVEEQDYTVKEIQ